MLEPPRPPLSVFLLTVVAGLGACAIFVGALIAWLVVVPGVLMLVAALAALWVIQHRRDRTLW